VEVVARRNGYAMEVVVGEEFGYVVVMAVVEVVVDERFDYARVSQSLAGLWLAPSPLLLLLHLQLPHPNHRPGHDQAQCLLEACVLAKVPAEVIDDVGVAWLRCGGSGVGWLVEVHFGDVSKGWVFWIFDDGGEGLR
jgi:hypothetical protein